MHDLYLKFDTEAEARAVLYTDEQQNFANTDIIGTIYKPTGKMLEGDEGEVPEMVALDGYHVNVRVVGEEESAKAAEMLVQFVINTPNNPVRMWA